MHLLLKACERVLQTFISMIDITKKGYFNWLEESEKAFKRMKEVMSSCHVLSPPGFYQPFVLECDASGNGIGALLMKNKHAMAYETRNL